MNYAMTAEGQMQFPDRTVTLRWDVEDDPKAVKHSVLKLLNEQGKAVRQMIGRTFGLAQERAVVFSTRAASCQKDLNSSTTAPGSPDYIEAQPNEYVDLVRIPHPVTRPGPCEAFYFSPRAALQLRRLADRQRDPKLKSPEKTKISADIDQITRTGSVRFPLEVKTLAPHLRASLSSAPRLGGL